MSEGAAAEDVDFSLSLGGVITGKITDGDGRPVIGERISLKPVDSADAPTIIPNCPGRSETECIQPMIAESIGYSVCLLAAIW